MRPIHPMPANEAIQLYHTERAKADERHHERLRRDAELVEAARAEFQAATGSGWPSRAKVQ